MEPNFQTSFIPKRPMIEERVSAPAGNSLLTVISIFVFFIVVIASAGLFFYKGVLTKNLAQMETDLTRAKAGFEPSKIMQLQQFDKRLSASKDILSKHVAVSPIFEILEGITLKTIQYTSFGYKIGEGGKIEVQMKGQASGYRSIALQSDLFTKKESIIDPVFSELALDAAGNVLFDLKFTVDSNVVNYKNMLQAKTQEDSTASSTAATGDPVDLPN